MPPTKITTKLRKEIRRLHWEEKLGFWQISQRLGIAYETARRHASAHHEARIKKHQRERHMRECKDPVVVARKRAAALRHAQKKREQRVARLFAAEPITPISAETQLPHGAPTGSDGLPSEVTNQAAE